MISGIVLRLPREDIASLAEKGADTEPESIRDGPLVGGLPLPIVLPLVGSDPGQEEHGDGDPQVGRRGVDPHLDGERLEEGERTGRRRKLFLV